jgi:hypothetical protein
MIKRHVVYCRFCWANQGASRKATHIAAQSHNEGITITWVPICASEIKGWNDGGDWKAPIYQLGQLVPHKETLYG